MGVKVSTIALQNLKSIVKTTALQVKVLDEIKGKEKMR